MVLQQQKKVMPGDLSEEGLQALLGRLAQRAGYQNAHDFFDGATFMCLGSGDGRAVITTAAWFPELRLSIGVERNGELWRAAMAAVGDTEKAYEDLNIGPRVELIHGDVDIVLPKLLKPPFQLPEEQTQTIIVWVNDRFFGQTMRTRLFQRLDTLISKYADVFIIATLGPPDSRVGFFTRRCVAWVEEEILDGAGDETDVLCFRLVPQKGSTLADAQFDWELWDADMNREMFAAAETLDGALGRRLRCGPSMLATCAEARDNNEKADLGITHMPGLPEGDGEHSTRMAPLR